MTRPAKLAPVAPQPQLGEVLDFMRLIWAMYHGLQKTSKRMRSTIGVTGPQRLVILILGRFPGSSAGQVAQLLHIHPSTLTGILRRLEQEGRIRRRPDPRDGRKAVLDLTHKGRVVDEVAAGTVQSAVQLVISRTSGVRLEAARGVLTDLAAALDSKQ